MIVCFQTSIVTIFGYRKRFSDADNIFRYHLLFFKMRSYDSSTFPYMWLKVFLGLLF